MLGQLEHAIHDESDLPPLVRVGLIHAQFETVHPYLDGNGRLGRLLITLLLREWGLLTRPLLYLSLYLKMHRQEYDQRLGAIRESGDWEDGSPSFSKVSRLLRRKRSTPRADPAIVTEKRERCFLEDAGVESPPLRGSARAPDPDP
ncbi:MAG: Fic family protein [Gemmatimonadota bacterium]